jgi:hypothetical protein
MSGQKLERCGNAPLWRRRDELGAALRQVGDERDVAGAPVELGDHQRAADRLRVVERRHRLGGRSHLDGKCFLQ